MKLTPRERCLVALAVLDGFADRTPHCSLGDRTPLRVDRWFRELASAMDAEFGPLPATEVAA